MSNPTYYCLGIRLNGIFLSFYHLWARSNEVSIFVLAMHCLRTLHDFAFNYNNKKTVNSATFLFVLLWSIWAINKCDAVDRIKFIIYCEEGTTDFLLYFINPPKNICLLFVVHKFFAFLLSLYGARTPLILLKMICFHFFAAHRQWLWLNYQYGGERW